MIDIHNHLLYGVDDGANSMEESLAMVQQAREQGIQAIVLTPHYRHGMFAYPKEKIITRYRKLKPQAEALGVELYLGCEYHVNSRIVEAMQTGKCLTLADSDYVLTEYDFGTEYSYIYEQTKKLAACGYIPVIAHVERYECILSQPKRCVELSNAGAYIQINADSILGLDGKAGEKCCKKLLKHQWADIVASDAHGTENRANHLGKCMSYVQKKYGNDYAELLFFGNPGKIIAESNK